MDVSFDSKCILRFKNAVQIVVSFDWRKKSKQMHPSIRDISFNSRKQSKQMHPSKRRYWSMFVSRGNLRFPMLIFFTILFMGYAETPIFRKLIQTFFLFTDIFRLNLIWFKVRDIEYLVRIERYSSFLSLHLFEIITLQNGKYSATRISITSASKY